MRTRLVAIVALPCLPLLLACPPGGAGGSSSSSSSGSSGADAGPGDAGPVVPVCDVHAAGAPWFTNATEAWGLGPSGLDLTGNRIIAADLDGDGYPDLVVHAVSSNRRESVGAATHLVRLLLNRPRPGGGRVFVDATQESGAFQVRGGSTTEYRSAQVAVAADVDNDGDLDLFSGTYADPTHPETDPGDRSEVLLNDGQARFTLAPLSDVHRAANLPSPTSGATFADVDRDGRIDLFVGFWYEEYGASYLGVQAELYQGAGDGTFQSITRPSGLLTANSGYADGYNHRPAYGVTSCDVDGDGAPDLMVSAYGRQWNLLYQNDGSGMNFWEVGQQSGYAGDDKRDYSDNQFFACYCTMHGTEADCQGVARPRTSCPNPADAYWSPRSDAQPWRLNGNTFATYCADLDGDGDMDLYNAEIRHWHIGDSSDTSELLRNDGAPGTIAFTRPGNDVTGMVWPHPTSDWNEGGLMAAGGDLDNDGREDVVVAASDYPDQFGLIFRQKPDHTFEEVGAAWGLHHACMSGLVVADLDRDGDLDVVAGASTARDCARIYSKNVVTLYENQLTPARRWLLVRLVGDGTTTNKSAIGARVTVTSGTERIVKELSGGYGHFGMQNDTVLFFGVGDCESLTSVEVRWPNRALDVQRFDAVVTNRFVELRQGDPAVHVVLPGG